MMNAAAPLVLLALAAGCADSPHALIPTSATPAAPPSSAFAPVPDPDARLLQREAWQLQMTVRSVDGAAVCGWNAGSTRQVGLGMDVYENGAVVMYYDHARWPEQPQAHWTGWRNGQGYEGAGVSYEALACGASSRSAGSPTTLTGYFSTDGNTFSGAEARRLILPDEAEIVYYVDWLATRVS